MSKPTHVLVVDDDQTFRESVANMLLLCGVDEFEVVGTIQEAQEKFEETRFDIVLVDLFMPRMKGLKLARQFRKKRPGTRVIVVMEDSQPERLNKAQQKQLNFPTILKSFIGDTLPRILSEDPDPLT